jgi:hypothetical protein
LLATETAPAAPPPAAGVVPEEGFAPSKTGERNFVKADLLPGDDE